ncbi:translation initiation factor [Sphingobacterium sp. HJSM2_6]|uniref:translation initiation factor n=1 Tax=Sphingobacterium sp. HJSM2_6 TaxID=3366264 RepID=UPI003BD81C7C
MSKPKKQRYDGVVFSTASDFEYTDSAFELLQETLSNNKQKLKVGLDKKSRKGKTVTLITGFVGIQEDLDILAKQLKQRCGVGGTSKDGEIMIQGDFKEKIIQFLQSEGYQVKSFG